MDGQRVSGHPSLKKGSFALAVPLCAAMQPSCRPRGAAALMAVAIDAAHHAVAAHESASTYTAPPGAGVLCAALMAAASGPGYATLPAGATPEGCASVWVAGDTAATDSATGATQV